jgi:hypothetical protein
VAGVGGHGLGSLGEHHPHLTVVIFVEGRQDRGAVMDLADGQALDEMESVPHLELRLSPPIT